MSAGRCNVLISSAGRRVALLRLFEEALREAGLEGDVHAADLSKVSSAVQTAQHAIQVPRCTTKAFISAMLEYCEKHQISLVIPTIDTELEAYAAQRDAFAKIGTTVNVSAPKAIEISGNKIATHRWLVAEGFPTVQQFGIEELDKTAAFPLLVKPVAGSSAVGVGIVNDLEELRYATRDGEYIAQSIAKGDEFTVDVYVDGDGICLAQVPRKRLEVRAGEVSKAVTVRDEKLMALAGQIVERLPGAFGVMCVQIFLSDEGDMRVIEINARFGGGYPLSWAAGAHFPTWLIRQVAGQARAPSASELEWNDGQVMLRYDDAVFTTREAVGL